MTAVLQRLQSNNEILCKKVLEELICLGVEEVILCPGGRNAPLVKAFEKSSQFTIYNWSEERSATYFALGKSKISKKPVVICTTSGTAAAEALPAAMEAFYTEIPLIILTADRPRRFRGSGAPQCAEQVGLFGQYAIYSVDIADEELVDLKNWSKRGPLHINLCIEEPVKDLFDEVVESRDKYPIDCIANKTSTHNALDNFMQKCKAPLVVVSAIAENAKEAICEFLVQYNAPVYLEGVSFLREDNRLKKIALHQTDKLLEEAKKNGYNVDGVLRIGGVPTFRLWRDLEKKEGEIEVLSISDLNFSGLSWSTVEYTDLENFFSAYKILPHTKQIASSWLNADRAYEEKVQALIKKYPQSEIALLHEISKKMGKDSLVYLGNSLPIREWDSFAVKEDKNWKTYANRGLNGIEGQISTFLGMCTEQSENWGIIGDLTAIYDLAGFWIVEQMQAVNFNLIIINNRGGKIFSKLFSSDIMQNNHTICFKSLAEFWKIGYVQYPQIPDHVFCEGHRIIEINPDQEQTDLFWQNF